jgi:hypothetical protein
VPRSIDELLPGKPEVPVRLIYAYSIADAEHDGLLKVGQTSQKDAKTRIEQQLKTAAIHNYTIHVEESGERTDGTLFSDFDVRTRLSAKGFENTELEWMRCTVADVKTAIAELRDGVALSGTHHLRFGMRPEQAEAVEKTLAYYQSIWAEDEVSVPRFLWNAKMRFGKTFTTYQLAKRLKAKRVLVVTFKPAVEQSWAEDLDSHADFNGWLFASAGGSNTVIPEDVPRSQPLVYFGSFQDLLGRDKAGNIKAKNEWVHLTDWDLVVFDEYHFGAWRESAKELFEGEDSAEAKREADAEYGEYLADFNEDLDELTSDEADFLPISTKAYLYLSGTPFRAISSGEFIEEQIFNWTYTDEQRAKQAWPSEHPGKRNPYESLPEMRLLTYQMPDELVAIAKQGEFDEFDLNEFFAATGEGSSAEFIHKDEVQKWLEVIRGAYSPTQVDNLKLGGSKPPFPYSDVRLLPYLVHSFWFLPRVSSCFAMRNLLAEKQNVFYHDYDVLVVAGTGAGIGLSALPPVKKAIGSGRDTKTIVLSCGKLTTGVTVPQWSSIFMLRNLTSPETYFQAAFRVQSPWSVTNPEGDNPNAELVLKPVAYVFDFAPTRALRQVSEYGLGLSPEESNPEKAVTDLVGFLPVLAYDGTNMVPVDAGSILDIAMSGTSATLLARKWESALLVNVDNETLRRILGSPEAMAAILSIEGFRALGSDIIETVVNKSEAVKATKREKGDDITKAEKKELTDEEKEYKSKRKQIQEKLIKFATRIPAFMYLTDYRENTLKDVITKIEPGLFQAVTGLTIRDFNTLVQLGVFNSAQMNQAVFAFRRYEDSSLSYTGIDSHPGLTHYGLFDTVIAEESVVTG